MVKFPKHTRFVLSVTLGFGLGFAPLYLLWLLELQLNKHLTSGTTLNYVWWILQMIQGDIFPKLGTSCCHCFMVSSCSHIHEESFQWNVLECPHESAGHSEPLDSPRALLLPAGPPLPREKAQGSTGLTQSYLCWFKCWMWLVPFYTSRKGRWQGLLLALFSYG